MTRDRSVLTAWMIGMALSACTPASDTAPYLDPRLSAQERAADLVARMTLEEKAQQVGHTAPAIERLGVPAYNWWNEGLHGVARAGEATVFPQAIGMAAAWDTERMGRVADVIATEFRAKYLDTLGEDGSSDWYRGLTVWSPNINIFRDPRWGRGQETYGEDPYLTGQTGLAFVRGLQGDAPDHPLTIATAKHFAVHSGPESNRHREDVHPSAFDLHDTYLPAFRTLVTEGRVASIMCAYNAVDGVPACGNDRLLNDLLRDRWGFDGYVVSDCGGAANIFRADALAYTETPEAGVALAFNSGMDLVCGDYRNNMSTEIEPIINAVSSGLLDEAVIDRALERLFAARIRLGQFDATPAAAWAGITSADYDTPEHREVALDMARASMVLLRNAGNVLPLTESPRRIAVIGPNANSLDSLIGNYNGLPSAPVTVLDGLRARFPDAEISHSIGTGLVGDAEPDVPDNVLCVDRACEQPGLTATYFADAQLIEDLSISGLEANARALWSGVAMDRAVRWSGYLQAPEAGDYSLRLINRNGYRIWLDGELAVDAWDSEHPPSVAAGTISLAAGQVISIRVEAVQRGPRGEQRLVWMPPGDRVAEAVAAAADADLAIFVGGLSWRIEGEEMRVDAPGFSGGDRTSLDLPAPQQNLLEAVHATGTPVVLVLMSGSAISLNWADTHIPAIVQAWYPGGQGGTAVAEMLAGDYNPAGRLPVTFHRSVEDLPAFTDYSMQGRTYRYFEGEALYPFGHGLSYTRFRYGEPTASASSINAGDSLTVNVPVTNAGERAGEEVVQLYLERPDLPAAPLRSLAGFRRIHLEPGETRTVAFTLTVRDLSTIDPNGSRRIAPGEARIWVGGGQPVSRPGLPAAPGQTLNVSISGELSLPE